MEDRRSLPSVSSTGDDHPSPPTDKAGLYSTVQQNEDDEEVSHVSTHIIAVPSTRSRLSGFGWWWEVFATALAVASTAAIIAVLLEAGEKPLDSWKLQVQPNSLVSVFSTITKSALLVPIAACISQLKWSYFESPRTLSQMQVFDDASRGPRGALLMLWKTRTTLSLAWLGDLVTLLLLAFDPFTQRVVSVKTRDMVMVNETSSLSYAPSFKDERLHGGVGDSLVDPHGRLTFSLALMAALTGRSSIYESNKICGTKACTYPSHVSLGVQTKCETREIRTTEAFGCAYFIQDSKPHQINDDEPSPEEQATRRFARLQDFKNAKHNNKDILYYGMNCTINKTDFPDLNIKYRIHDKSNQQGLTGEGHSHIPRGDPFPLSVDHFATKTVFGNPEVQQDSRQPSLGTGNLDSREITGWPFAFCTSRRYAPANPFGSDFHTLDNFTVATFSCLDSAPVLPGIANLDTFGEFNATISHCSMTLVSAEYTNPAFEASPGDQRLADIQIDRTVQEKSTLRPLQSIEPRLNRKQRGGNGNVAWPK